jgi:hypothetical protein
MNLRALQYYKMWFERRYNPWGFYVLLFELVLIFVLSLAIYFRSRVGDWSFTPTIMLLGGIAALVGGALAFTVQRAAQIGNWVLVEKLEDGYRSKHYREVWQILMLSYRNLHPTIVANRRFQELFVGIASHIEAHEELTAEQAAWLGDVLSVAEANLRTPGRTLADPSSARFMKALVLTYLAVNAIFVLMKIIEVANR